MASAHIKQTVDNIVKSAEDKRLYRGLELANGMKVNINYDALPRAGLDRVKQILVVIDSGVKLIDYR